jgi:hypothetical protein
MQVFSTQQRRALLTANRMTIIASRLVHALPEKLTAAHHRSGAGLASEHCEIAYMSPVSGADRTAYHAGSDDGRRSIVARPAGRVPASHTWLASISTRALAHAEAA